jgi:hypothetical protein
MQATTARVVLAVIGLALVLGGLLLALALASIAAVILWRLVVVTLRLLGFTETSRRCEGARVRFRSALQGWAHLPSRGRRVLPEETYSGPGP